MQALNVISAIVLCLPNGCAWAQSAGEPKFVKTKRGLRCIASGTLNGSSPSANLAGANIKGRWISPFSPTLVRFLDSDYDRWSYPASAQR